MAWRQGWIQMADVLGFRLQRQLADGNLVSG